MATSGGQSLVPKALKMLRFAIEKTCKVLRDKVPQAAKSLETQVRPVYARNAVQNQPISRIAAIRQSQSRWYSTQQVVRSSLRKFSSSTRFPPKYDRSALPSSRTSQAVSRLASRAPFASSLRPSLTGGALCRSAGGYGTGAGRIGGARCFSHTPAAPAQVVNNVSQAVRAFWLSGQKAQFDGMNSRGEKQFRTASAVQEKAGRMLRSRSAAAPGSYIDFKVTPTITALGPLNSVSRGPTMDEQESLNNVDVMKILAVDFARALKDLAMIMNDLEKLSVLGDLPLSLPNPSTLRVRFPGCDLDTINCLCKDLEICRGLVYQDEDFDLSNGTEMALLFPFAPTHTPSEMTFAPRDGADQDFKYNAVNWQNMLSPQRLQSPNRSTRSIISDEFEEVRTVPENPWLFSGYSSLNGSDEEDAAAYFRPASRKAETTSSAYEGVEGIYRFLEECDRARR